MSKIRKMLWSRLLWSSKRKGRQGKEDVNSHKGNPTMSEEYNEAFRTKSYAEICSKVEDQLGTRMSPDEGHSLSSPFSSNKQHRDHLSEYLLDPPQEALTSILKGSRIHRFLIKYLDKSQEASRVCELILQNVHQVGSNHHPIKNITNLIKQTPDPKRWTHHHYEMLYKNLASFAKRKNPFQLTQDNFLELHDGYISLLHQLTSKYRKTRRRTKLIKYAKQGVSALLMVGSTVLAAALLVLAANSVAVMVAAPGLIVCCLSFLAVKRLRKQKRKSRKAGQKSGLGTQLDVAARGVYTLINDLDTVGRLVGGLYDEVERRKVMAEVCVERGKDEMVKELVRELQADEPWFLEEVEELKRHVCLCFLNINRARRLLVKEMV